MDARRLGMGVDLLEAFLVAAAPVYMADAGLGHPERRLRAEGRRWNTPPCRARVPRGPLTHRPGRSGVGQPSAGPACQLADYLDQHGRARRADQIPPPEFWAAAAAHAGPADQAALGRAAHDRGLYRDAAQLYKNATAHGHSHAASLLVAQMHTLHPADPRPAEWAAAHASLDDPRAVDRLLETLRKAGAREQAATVAERALKPRVPSEKRVVVNLLPKTAARLAELHAAADAPLDDLDVVTGQLGSRSLTRVIARMMDLLRPGAEGQVAAVLARDPAAHVPLDDPDGRGQAAGLACGRRARRSRPPRCWPATPPPTSPSTTRPPWPACWTGCGRRARPSRPPRWPAAPPPAPPSTTRAP